MFWCFGVMGFKFWVLRFRVLVSGFWVSGPRFLKIDLDEIDFLMKVV